VQREDPLDVLEHPGVDRVQRAAGHALLGRLEDHPDPAGQGRAGGQRERRAEHRGRVHVVTAGVADTRHRGHVRDVLDVLQRQRVDVRAQRHHPLARADLAGQTGADRQHPGLQADRLQGLDQLGGGAVLGVPELGMAVQIATERDQIRTVLGEPLVQPGQLQRPRRRSCHSGSPTRVSSSNASTTGRESPSDPAVTRRGR
jgi:hypothetical protein